MDIQPRRYLARLLLMRSDMDFFARPFLPLSLRYDVRVDEVRAARLIRKGLSAAVECRRARRRAVAVGRSRGRR